MHTIHLTAFGHPGAPGHGRFTSAVHRVVTSASERLALVHRPAVPHRSRRGRPCAWPLDQARFREFLDEVLGAGVDRSDLE